MASGTKSKSGGGTKSASRTSRPGATARAAQARKDRVAAEKRRARTGKGNTEQPSARKGANRSVAEHSEHPEDRADSTVRHSEPQTGKRTQGAGEGGFPQGEYDVTDPAPAGADKRSIKEQLLDAHFGSEDVEKHLAKADQKARLDRTTVSVAIETTPVGTIIEHDAPNRWRVRTPTGGGNRYGFGSTFREAVESYVLGDAVTNEQEAAAQRFSELSPAQQKEIQERDEKAARRVGQDPSVTPEAIARREAAENAKAESKALGNKKARVSQTTDGAERASARDAQGQKRGARESIAAYDSGSQSRASQARASSKK